MRFLILSDIHSNLEALQAVLEDSQGLYERIVSAGDLVGYGADPEAVIDWARGQDLTQVRGNHDKACAGLVDMEWFSERARAAAEWTLVNLSQAGLEYLRQLPQGPLTVAGFQLFHGSPMDEDEYLLERPDVMLALRDLDFPLSFFGHSHLQGGFLATHGGIAEIPVVAPGADERLIDLTGDEICLANPGSVGQPRDGDPRAAYMLFSSEERLLRYRRVSYDIGSAQRKIRKAGLPADLAARLSLGR